MNSIICNPYEKPDKYWKYIDSGKYEQINDRRPASYKTMKSNGSYGSDIEIKWVDTIRKHVEKWSKEETYAGVTEETRKILIHWGDEERKQRMFFCQLEAIRTIIYLFEVNLELLDSLDKDGYEQDSSPFLRQCIKMATGTGKTIVMGMLLAWLAINNNSPKHSKNVLIVTPGITVKDRLQVLKPTNKNNIYDEFELMPESKRMLLNNMNINITNYHQITEQKNRYLKGIKEEKIINEDMRIETEQAVAKRLVGENTENVLVINDEGHHAWSSDVSGVNKADQNTATTWIKGLNMIHNVCGINICYDFSATPFIPTGKSSIEKTLFRWIISDFSLSDAIESGLVKTPYAAVDDISFGHLYSDEEVRGALKKGNFNDKIETSYMMLKEKWEEMRNSSWKNHPTPPVLITVCNSVKDAKTVMSEFKKNKTLLPKELSTEEAMQRIDSGIIDDGKRSKKDIEIREMINTVGKEGQPGEKICNVVSVSMLTEGWDVRTVACIMGLRAFTSQLLCEQVVGRGLRRRSYVINPDTEMFDEERVILLGVPIGLITISTTKPPTDRELVKACPIDLKKEHEIKWPMVELVKERTEYKSKIKLVDIEEYLLDESIQNVIYIGPTMDGKPSMKEKILKSDRHEQQIAFDILRLIIEYKNLNEKFNGDYDEAWKDMKNSDKYKILVDLLDIIENFLKSSIKTELTGDERVEKIGAQTYLIARHISKYIFIQKENLLEPKIYGEKSTQDMQCKYFSKRHVHENPDKSHLNIIIAYNEFEKKVSKLLDENIYVKSYVKADIVGFYVNYDDKNGITRKYRPDFIIYLTNRLKLVLEAKGEKRDAELKKKALERWVNAVNNNGDYGIWASDIIYKRSSTDDWQTKLLSILQRHASLQIKKF